MNSWSVGLVFDCMSGNTGLTEEFIYRKLGTKNVLYEVLSSATTGETGMGYIPMCALDNGRPLRTFEGKPGILIARNGKAGQMTYLEIGKYTINDHAYIISVKESFKKKVRIATLKEEQNFLLWFICTHQPLLYSFASKNDNATWNKSSFLRATLDIPSSQKREEIATLYQESIHILKRAQKVIDDLSALLSKQIS